jgi:hypothetical protein
MDEDNFETKHERDLEIGGCGCSLTSAACSVGWWLMAGAGLF